MRTMARIVTGERRAKAVAAALIDASMWFQCELVPFAGYEFAVKEETLDKLVEIMETAIPQEKR